LPTDYSDHFADAFYKLRNQMADVNDQMEVLRNQGITPDNNQFTRRLVTNALLFK
jgi:hypothetical protein